MNAFLSTGQFATLVGTTKRTLFYYDSTGLLSPKLINSKGDRWYSKNQASAFNLIKLLNNSNIPLKDVLRALRTSNYSYKKLYSIFSKEISKAINTQNKSYSVILDAYSNTSKLLKKYEIALSPAIHAFVLESKLKYSDAIMLINSFNEYFNNIPENPTIFIKKDFGEEYSAGLIKEGGAIPKTKYINSFPLKTFTPTKSLKRAHLLTQTNEELFVNNLELACRTIDPTPKSIVLLMHNRNKKHVKYLCESYIIL